MDDDEELLSGRKARRRWMIALGFIPLLAAIGFGVWYFMDKQRHEGNTVRVDQVTGAAFGCVGSIRGEAPENWSLARALEHMSYMERRTREGGPALAEERARFAQLATDAARGCEELGTLMLSAQRDGTNLYFAVPAALAHPPDMDDPERWFRRVLPDTRPDAEELSRQIRVMAETINARRAEHSLMAQELPVEGRGASHLARQIEVAPIPRDRESPQTHVWPMPEAIVVIRRASIGRVPCDTRYLNRSSCLNEYVQHISWDGEPSEPVALERPARVQYWSAFAPTPDGSVWAIGVDSDDEAVAGEYRPGETTPELMVLEATIDATANIVAVTGGVAVFPPDGSAWFKRNGAPSFEQVSTTPPPLVVGTRSGGAARGVELESVGELSITGSAEDGYTSRMTPVGEDEDVLLRMIDTGSRVQTIASLRALRSGRAVAVLQRHEEAPDAIAITPDFGRSWLAAE